MSTNKETPSIKKSCAPLVSRLEELCPGAEFTEVTDERIRLLVPTRLWQTSKRAGVNVRSGREPMIVDLRELDQAPEDWLRIEIGRRAEGQNPDLVTRGEGGTMTKDAAPEGADEDAGWFWW